jgi:hypothetical protein
VTDTPEHPDFTKTDVYGLFKPAMGSLDHGRLHNVNWDLLDALIARLEDQVKRQEKMLRHIEKDVNERLLRIERHLWPEEFTDD